MTTKNTPTLPTQATPMTAGELDALAWTTRPETVDDLEQWQVADHTFFSFEASMMLRFPKTGRLLMDAVVMALEEGAVITDDAVKVPRTLKEKESELAGRQAAWDAHRSVLVALYREPGVSPAPNTGSWMFRAAAQLAEKEGFPAPLLPPKPE